MTVYICPQDTAQECTNRVRQTSSELEQKYNKNSYSSVVSAAVCVHIHMESIIAAWALIYLLPTSYLYGTTVLITEQEKLVATGQVLQETFCSHTVYQQSKLPCLPHRVSDKKQKHKGVR